MDAVVIEPERASDAVRIGALLQRAFDGERVPRMVDAIRASTGYEPELALSARIGTSLLGFVMISHAELEHGGTRRDVLTLSPLAVAEPFRRTGIGARLVRAVLAAAEARPELPRLVVLEGSPEYYGRLGFTWAPESGVEIELPAWAPREAAQVLRLSGWDPALRGRVRYPPAFPTPDAAENPADDAVLRRLAEDAGRLLDREVTPMRRLSGGGHADTAVIADGDRELVVRRFPDGDPAVARELEILPRIAALGPSVPTLVATDGDVLIVTTRIPGRAPDPSLAPPMLVGELAMTLARIHALDPSGLPPVTGGPDGASAVLVHGDFWCGNALWRGFRISGVVDWSGAGSGPPERDVAWCRNDLVLLGAPDAADGFADLYRTVSDRDLPDLPAWDRWAAERAHPVVGSWTANYAGIGRPEIDGPVLRRRLDDWMRHLGIHPMDR